MDYLFFFLSSGVKFSSGTKEFTVSIPGKGNAVFNMEKKVKMQGIDDMISVNLTVHFCKTTLIVFILFKQKQNTQSINCQK